MTGHSQWEIAELSQKFHKSNSLSPTTIRHLRNHFLNTSTAGKVVGRLQSVSRGHGKTLRRGPIGSFIHATKLNIRAEILSLMLRRGGERKYTTRSLKGPVSSGENMNTDSPLHYEICNWILKRMYVC